MRIIIMVMRIIAFRIVHGAEPLAADGLSTFIIATPVATPLRIAIASASTPSVITGFTASAATPPDTRCAPRSPITATCGSSAAARSPSLR